MAAPKHSRVQELRDLLKRQKAERQAQENTSTAGSPDPFAEPDEFGPPRLEGAPTAPKRQRTPEEERDPFLGPDTHLSTDGPGSSLHEFLENLDQHTDAVEEAAEAALAAGNQGAADILSQIGDERSEAIAREFVARTQSGSRVYIPTHENFVAVLKHMAQTQAKPPGSIVVDEDEPGEAVELFAKQGLWRVPNIMQSFVALYDAGELPDYPEGRVRPLTESETRSLSAMAASGFTSDAIVTGLRWMLGEAVFQRMERSGGGLGASGQVYDPAGILAKPEFAEAIDLITWLVFENSQIAYEVGYSPTPENRAALRAFIGDRFVTVDQLARAWNTIKGRVGRPTLLPEQSAQARAQQQPSREEVAAGLDDLDDEAIQDLYDQTVRERARQVGKKIL